MSGLWEDIFNTAVVHFRASEFRRAETLLSEAIRLGADKAKVFDLRANVLERLSRPIDALKDAKRVIQLSPKSAKGYARAAMLFHRIGSEKNANTMVTLALERCTDSTTRAELLDLKKAIEVVLEREREELSHRKCHIALLPNELLASVFEQTAEMNHVSPIHASHTCRHWRQIALSLPRLWKTLLIGDASWTKTRQKINVWGERNNGRLEELIVFQLLSADGLDRLFSEIHLSGMTCPKTIELLRVTYGLQEVSTRLKRILRSSFKPSVMRVKVGDESRNWVLLAPQILWSSEQNDESALSLKVLEASGLAVTFRYPPPCSMLQTLKLTEMTAHDLNSENFFHFLGSMPLLETLILELVVPYVDLTGRTDPLGTLVMAHLRELRFTRVGGAYSLLQGVQFPSLEVIQLSSSANGFVFPFLSEKLCPVDPVADLGVARIKELRLSSVTFKASELLSLLDTIGGVLEILEIKNSGEDINDIIDAMADRGFTPLAKKKTSPRNQPLCPKVHTLDLSQCIKLSGAPIKALVKSRLAEPSQGAPDRPMPEHPVTPIVSLTIDNCPLVEPQLLPWLRTQVKRVSCLHESVSSIRKNRRIAGQW